MSNLTRAELLSVKPRKWDEEIKNAVEVYVIPSKRKSGSDWACMDFVAKTFSGEMIRFGGCCDSVSLIGDAFKFDCGFKAKLIRIWNARKPNTFTISYDTSSVDFIQDADVSPSNHRIYTEFIRRYGYE